jgi:DNA-binding Lrp family transcriptional regulator
MITPNEPPYIALSNGIGPVRIAILQELSEEKNYEEIAENIRAKLKIEIDGEGVREKVEEMREQGVIKGIAPIVDPLKIWNHMYFVFVKASLAPPIIGVDMEYPKGWRDLCEMTHALIEEDVLAKKIVRQMYALQGTEWDMLLKITTNDMGELRELCEKITSCGFIEKVWSFEPVKGAKHYFDPIGIPSVDDITEGIKNIQSLSKVE